MNGKPFKNYADNLEPEVLEQIGSAMEQDWAVRGALMPDAHFGYSLPIGGVVATDGMVVPSWVGYDLGCFTGDTKIPLLDGTEPTLFELYNSKATNFFVYSVDNANGQYRIGKADKVKLTRKNAALVCVLLDNGEKVTCTPDHEFLLKTGKYLRADKLQKGKALFPFKRHKDKSSYEYLGKWWNITTAKVVAQSGLMGKIPEHANGTHIHHKDHSPSNNLPENLEFVDAKKHMSYHAKKNGTFKSEDFKKKKRKTIKDRGYNYHPDHLETKQKIGSITIKKYMKENPEHYAEVVKRNAIRGGKFFSKKNSDQDMILKQRIGRLNKILVLIKGKLTPKTYEKARKQVHNGITYMRASTLVVTLGYSCLEEYYNVKYLSAVGNHRVVSVTPIKRKEDVYCLTVRGYHNFALSSGVIVHNCGVAAYKTEFKTEDIEPHRQNIFNSIYRAIPTGRGHHRQPQEWDGLAEFEHTEFVRKQFTEYNHKGKTGYHQLGTLGGGNHFIEIAYDDGNNVWIVIHSGSRGVGWQTAARYMKLASKSDRAKEGHYGLRVDSQLGQDYVADLNFYLEFALENRKRMICAVMDEMFYYMQGIKLKSGNLPNLINRNHNHAVFDTKENLWIHRKGATHAEQGMMGVIPGNMRDGSFIVRGLGNPDSLYSSSHGAGRVLGRKQAQRVLNMEDFESELKGVTAKVGLSTLDESPSAYKDIFTVMQLQKDLVEVHTHLQPIINVKA